MIFLVNRNKIVFYLKPNDSCLVFAPAPASGHRNIPTEGVKVIFHLQGAIFFIFSK